MVNGLERSKKWAFTFWGGLQLQGGSHKKRTMGSVCGHSGYDVIDSHYTKTPRIEFYEVLVSNDTLGCFEYTGKIKSDSWRLNDG